MKTKAAPVVQTLLTIKDLCARWSISPRTVHRLKDEGELKFLRVGNQIRFPVASVIAYETGESQ